MTSSKASKMARPGTDPLEVAREGTKKKECDPESDNPCSIPKQRFMEPPDELPMPNTACNKMVLCVQLIRTRKPDGYEKGEYDKF
jgi:hypothetical protein